MENDGANWEQNAEVFDSDYRSSGAADFHYRNIRSGRKESQIEDNSKSLLKNDYSNILW